MKRLIVAMGFLMLLAWPAGVSASPPAWNLTGTYTINFVCTAGCVGDSYVHSMTITTSNDVTGAVVGTGSVQGYPGYNWTLTGTVDGSNVTFDIEWVAPDGMGIYNPMKLVGTIDGSGGMSGTASDAQSRAFTWATTAGAAATIAPTPTPTPVATATAVATATPTVVATATPTQAVEGQTLTPVITPPPTSSSKGPSDGSAPLFALLICLAFGALGLAATEAQRRRLHS